MCENLIDESMPPSCTSVRGGRPARLGMLWQCAARISAEFRQRMAGEIKAQHFLFVGQAFLFRPIGDVRQRLIGRVRGSSSPASNKPFCPARRSASFAAPACSARSSACHAAARLACSESKAPALIRLSTAVRFTTEGSQRSQKSNKLLNGPPACRAAAMAWPADPPQPLMAARANTIFPSHTEKSAADRFTFGGVTAKFHPAAIFQVLDQRIFLLEIAAVDIAGQHGRHEFQRIVRFQIRRHVGNQRVGRAVRFVEAVAGEFGDQLEQFAGLPLRSAPAPWLR